MENTEIDIDSIWVRDGKKYIIAHTCFNEVFLDGYDNPPYVINTVWYKDEIKIHVVTKEDFLKDFTPYHLTNEEAADLTVKFPSVAM